LVVLRRIILDIGTIDYWAVSKRSFLHSASPLCKIIFVVSVIASIVITNNFVVLLSIYLTLLGVVILTRLPFLKIVWIAAYPAIFAVFFAISSWDGNWITPANVILKALDAALTMVILIVTTPYPSVFSSISPFLPRIIVEGLFLTYRALFILLALMGNLIQALKIRGGLSPGRYVKNITNFASGIGLLIIRGFDLSERLYGVMSVRGYSGRIAEEETDKRFSLRDIIPIAVGLLILCVSLGIRFKRDLDQYSIYLFMFSALFVFIAAFYVYLLYAFRGAYWKK
jgi:cobalt/nickel transport system permease protein